jgi:K(+)-stimulated pyrophosphate-energized sodium pump
MLPETMKMDSLAKALKKFHLCVFFMRQLLVLWYGAVISSVTEYYTGLGTKPVMAIVQKSSTGAGTNVIAGLATGMISTFPTVLLCSSNLDFYALAGFYGVALLQHDGNYSNATCH